jgi:hypothetical protein
MAEIQERLADEKLISRTLHAFKRTDGWLIYSGVWGKPPAVGASTQEDRDLFEGNLADRRARRGDQIVIDVAVSQGGARRSVRDR